MKFILNVHFSSMSLTVDRRKVQLELKLECRKLKSDFNHTWGHGS